MSRKPVKLTLEWIVGFCWGVGTISDSRLLIRYHDEDLLLAIAESIDTKSRPFYPTAGKVALRIALSNILAQTLFRLGWTGRFDDARKYPEGNIHEIEFIRGYCHTKAGVSLWRYKDKKGNTVATPRLRIWGSEDIVRHIDDYFVRNLLTTPKKPQLCRGHSPAGYTGKTYCVHYVSRKEVPLILSQIEKEVRQCKSY